MTVFVRSKRLGYAFFPRKYSLDILHIEYWMIRYNILFNIDRKCQLICHVDLSLVSIYPSWPIWLCRRSLRNQLREHKPFFDPPCWQPVITWGVFVEQNAKCKLRVHPSLPIFCRLKNGNNHSSVIKSVSFVPLKNSKEGIIFINPQLMNVHSSFPAGHPFVTLSSAYLSNTSLSSGLLSLMTSRMTSSAVVKSDVDQVDPFSAKWDSGVDFFLRNSSLDNDQRKCYCPRHLFLLTKQGWIYLVA